MIHKSKSTGSYYKRLAGDSTGTIDVIVTLVTYLGLMAIALATGSLAARLLGPIGRGELAAVQNWPAMLALLGTSGLAEAVTYYSERDPWKAGQVLATSTVWVLLASVPLMLVGYVFMPWLLAAQSSMVVQEARLYLLFIPINVCTLLSLGALRGSRGLGLWNLIRITAGLSWLAVLLIAWVMEKETVMFVTRGFLAATLFLLLATWFLVPWWVSGPFRPKKTGLIPLLRYGLPSIFGAVPAQLNLRFDQLLMVALLPPQMLGFYAVTVSWNSGLLALGHSTAAVILPRLARLRLLADQTDVLARTLRLSVLLSGILGVPFLLMTPFAIKLLFGVAFVPAIPTAMVLVPATLISGINLVLADGLRGLGRPKWVMIAQLVGLVVTVVSLALLLRPYQIMGAAVASLLSYATILLLLVTFTVRETHMSVHVMLWPRREDLSRLWRVTWILRDHWVPDERRSQLSLYHKNPTGT